MGLFNSPRFTMVHAARSIRRPCPGCTEVISRNTPPCPCAQAGDGLTARERPELMLALCWIHEVLAPGICGSA